MEEVLNGESKDEVYVKLEVEEEGEVVVQDGLIDQIDDEALIRVNLVVAENGKASSSSSDEETEVGFPEKNDDSEITSTVKYEEENGVSGLIVEEPVVEIGGEIESSQDAEELEVAEVIKEQLITMNAVGETANAVNRPADGEPNKFVEEEREHNITEESAEAGAEELADVVEEKESGQVESAEENRTVEIKSSNGIDETSKVEITKTNGNPHIISISARTMRPTSWKGCCGLLEVFQRGD